MLAHAASLWIERLPCPVLVIAMEDGGLLFANRPAREKLGAPAAGMAAALFDDPAELVRLLATLRESGQLLAARLRLKSPDGGCFAVRADIERVESEGRACAVMALALAADPAAEHADRQRLERQLHEVTARLDAQVLENRGLRERLDDLALRDPLTGLFDRRHMEDTLGRELARALPEERPLSLAMVDIDHFKLLNDTHGYRAGDLVLKKLAGLLRERLHGEELACRFGGEEFVVILPGTPLAEAARRAEDWRAGFQALDIIYEGRMLHATLSTGIAGFPRHGATGDELLFQADSALYMAKRAGRNRVMVWG